MTNRKGNFADWLSDRKWWHGWGFVFWTLFAFIQIVLLFNWIADRNWYKAIVSSMAASFAYFCAWRDRDEYDMAKGISDD